MGGAWCNESYQCAFSRIIALDYPMMSEQIPFALAFTKSVYYILWIITLIGGSLQGVLAITDHADRRKMMKGTDDLGTALLARPNRQLPSYDRGQAAYKSVVRPKRNGRFVTSRYNPHHNSGRRRQSQSSRSLQHDGPEHQEETTGRC